MTYPKVDFASWVVANGCDTTETMATKAGFPGGMWRDDNIIITSIRRRDVVLA